MNGSVEPLFLTIFVPNFSCAINTRKDQHIYATQASFGLFLRGSGKVHFRRKLCNFSKTPLDQSKSFQIDVLGRTGHGSRIKHRGFGHVIYK